MKNDKERKPMFTDVQRQIIASSLEAVIELDRWLYCHYEDPERARLGLGLTSAKRVEEVVNRTRDNELTDFGQFELTMMREAVLATLAAGLDLGATHDDMLAIVRQIQKQRTEVAIRQHEPEGSETARIEHFRFTTDLASRAFGELAGLNPAELSSFAGHYASEIPTPRDCVRRHLAAVHRMERRSEEWIRRDRVTWDPGLRWNLYSEVQHDVCEASVLLECPDYPKLPSQQRDWVIATLLRIAPLIDWDLRFTLADILGVATPPQTPSST